ncbi:MAG: GLPGLI family protein [Flavobacterium sp.]|jgi:GLPGLI family protein|uniref:GLPGLI family protein n=1 Tax=Flavobacterium sp. TaxID=239 RepID=UPI001B53AC94|nr:GLPGLI family protein [Flavobacterium sp.]MBP6146396.1 GLPGLI family protein [Flavobacterium sp.]MBP7183525.1 GLPGLI family protein [Flavobacterium sp.]MBP7318944.1 GLPGLI family protein [Flavobacterium sp.]MBP8887611.1 GLPGLI family protein [Flavobacterium sp.]HRL70277.1 GLPGLI family protein [Flavobacterium sp.]
MYKVIIAVVLTVASYMGLRAQEFQGMAVYESKTSTSDFKSRMEGNREMTPDMQKRIEERMKKMFEKTFILNFDKSASIYKEEERLDAPGQGSGGMRMMSSMTGGGGTYYKNVKEKSYTVDKEFMGKEFLVKDSLPNLKWKMEGETRMIGGYNCFKATAVRPASKTDFRNLRPRREDAAATKPADTDKKTSLLDALDMPKETVITAWYTPEIPVNQGPRNYWGLPGLILEVNDGKTVILCSKVVLNPKVKTEIKAPTKGKVTTQKEFDETVVKKMEEFRDMNQGRGRNGGMRTRFGG